MRYMWLIKYIYDRIKFQHVRWQVGAKKSVFVVNSGWIVVKMGLVIIQMGGNDVNFHSRPL